MATNRNKLDVCVEIVNELVSVSMNETISRVESVFESKLIKHPRWSELGYHNFSYRITSGCPSHAYMLIKGATHPLLQDAGFAAEFVPIVKVPSQYRLHIYIVPKKVIVDIFKDIRLTTAPQEILCDESDCFEVTTALYLSPPDIRDLTTLQEKLEKVLALNIDEILAK